MGKLKVHQGWRFRKRVTDSYEILPACGQPWPKDPGKLRVTLTGPLTCKRCLKLYPGATGYSERKIRGVTGRSAP